MVRKYVLGKSKTCVGCKTCMTACLTKHFEDDDIPLFRINVVKLGDETIALACRHCEKAPCVNACPVGALYYDLDRVAVNMHRCIGCSGCINNCPYGSLVLANRPQSKVASGLTATSAQNFSIIKCDLCFDREQGPACVEACTTKSLRLLSMDEVNQVASPA
ncbi:MAG: 4Fe-4S ferredoxin [Coriobacteriia bacterium]|nr:4Fe-4S ferredoxin [Coriobacteriia bacterium]